MKNQFRVVTLVLSTAVCYEVEAGDLATSFQSGTFSLEPVRQVEFAYNRLQIALPHFRNDEVHTVFPKEEVRMKIGGKEKRSDFDDDRLARRIEFPTKVWMPDLYYLHFEEPIRHVGEPEGVDSVARRWRLSPRSELLFPFARWDWPGIRERVFFGVGVSFTFR